MNKKKILVIGASGVLGDIICAELLNTFSDDIELFIGDYSPQRGQETAEKYRASYCNTDLDDVVELSSIIIKMDLVVVTIKQSEPIIQKICIEGSVNCIDVTLSYSFAKKVADLFFGITNVKSTSVVMAGLFPGLSGVMLEKIVSGFDTVTNINMTMIQNMNVSAGGNGIKDMLAIISKDIEIAGGKKYYPGFKIKRNIEIPQLSKRYAVRMITYPERNVFFEKYKLSSINYWTAWNSRIFTTFISFLVRTKLIKICINKLSNKTIGKIVKHNDKRTEEIIILAEVDGEIDGYKKIKRICLKSFSDYGTTAKTVAALAITTFKNRFCGFVYPFQIAKFDDIISIINDNRLEIYEY